jgi:Lon protease-like protein
MESWNEIIATNLTGIFVCCEAVLPIMRQQQGGLIVNVSSMAGVQASLVSGVAYSASKFGVMSLTQSLNLEEWRNGIRATVIAPGEVNTPIMEKRPNPPPPHAYPLMIQPEDLGAMIAFLAQLPPRVVVEEIRVRPMPMSRPEEAMEDTRVVPLFPLATVLFPGAVLPLRVFEDRYKVMVRECLQTDGSLGIVLIREGWEVGDPATPFEVGTLARIIRTEAASDGTLSIAVIGRRRFRIQSLLDGKPYRQGAVELLADDPPKLAESELSRLRRRLGEYRELLGRLSPESQPRFRLPAGPLELSYAVAGQLRIPRAEQQRLLEVTAEQRLRLANDILRRELVLLRHLGAIASPRLPAPASLPKN